MNIDGSSLVDAGKSIGESYVKFVEDKIESITKKIQKLTQLKDLDFDNAWKEVKEEELDALGDVIDLTSTVFGGLASNPLVNTLVNQLEEKYNLELGSPMGVIKAILGGEVEGVLAVGTSMLYFPIARSEYMLYCGQLLSTGKLLVTTLEAQGVDFETLEALNDEMAIPTSTIAKAQSAYRNLSTAVGGNIFKPSSYDTSKTQIQEVINELSGTETWSSVSGVGLDMATKLAVDNLSSTFKNDIGILDKAKDNITTCITTIQSTDIQKNAGNTALDKPQKVARDLYKIVQQMQSLRVSPDIIAIIPQMIVSLSGIKQALIAYRPTVKEPPPVFPNRALVWNVGKINEVDRKLGRLYNLTKYPRRLGYLPSMLDDLEDALDELNIEFDSVQSQIDNLWTFIPGIRTLIEEVKKYCSDNGMDNALNALNEGNMEALKDMSQTTATVVGATLTAIMSIKSVFYVLGVDGYSMEKVTAIEKRLAKSEEEVAKKSDSKKNKKLKKLQKDLKEATDAFNQLSEEAVMIAGLATTLYDLFSSVMK